MSPTTVKFVKSRDAATAILRKMEIKPRDYDFYIEKLASDKVAVNVGKAQAFLDSLVKAKVELADVKLGDPAKEHAEIIKAAKPKKTKAKVVAKTEPTKAEKPMRISCSSVAKALIKAGKTNQEVWDVISKQFKLDATKKHYPTWYRCQLKREVKKAS